MLIILLASTIGIIEGLYIEFTLCMVLYFFVLVICVIFKANLSKVALFICFSFMFYIYTNLQIHIYDTKYENGILESNFKIISYKDEKQYYDKYIAKNDKGDKFLIYLPKDKELKKGTIIHASGEFVIPDLVRNTGGFNYRRYLNSQRIFGSVYISDYYINELDKFNFIYWVQDEIYNSLAKLFPKDEMGLILGMMIGETKDISDEVMEDFKNTGITHLVAVSGSNVAYVLFLVQFIFKKIVGKMGSYFISIFFIILFMFVSGASSSVIRASIMIILSIIANIIYLRSDTISNISFSALVLMIISPLIIYDIGFILSFGGTIGIVLLSKDFEKIFSKFGVLKETLSVTCSAQLVLLPIMMYYFNTVSILSVITNLIVVPISGSITILGFSIFLFSKICFPIAKLMANLLYVLAKFTISIAKMFSSISFSQIQTITPNIFEIILFYFLLFYLIGKVKVNFTGNELTRKVILKNKCDMKQKEEFRFIGSKKEKPSFRFVLFLIIFFILVEGLWYLLPRNYIDIRCVDVGQGDCVFIKTNDGKNILVDGGGSETYDVGKNILLPYLRDMRVINIDTIILSHSDADHMYGIISVLENFNVKRIIIAKNSLGYEKIFEIAKKKNIDIFEVLKGDILQIGDITLEVISPDKNDNNIDVNNYSLVVKLIYGEESILFTGDIGQNVEKNLSNVDADILKVAHHGSKSSSNERFIKNVSPSLAIIGVVENNKYGHPSKEVLDILNKTSKVYTTAEYGEIKIRMYKNYLKVLNR